MTDIQFNMLYKATRDKRIERENKDCPVCGAKELELHDELCSVPARSLQRYGHTHYPLSEEGKSCQKKGVGFLTKLSALWKGV